MERVADYVIRRIVETGIGHIFLITGRGILYLTDAVARNKDIEGISTYHEQGASYAAMAYAAAKDGMGACLVSTGCAATNAVTAALCAYQDNLPVIFVSGQHMLNETTRYTGVPIRTYGSQEADIISVVESVTKYAVMLTDASNVRRELDKAFYLANEGRKGPVWIDIPIDIQNVRIEAEKLAEWDIPGKSTNLQEPDILDVAGAFEKAERPVILVGGGVRVSGAVEGLAEFVESNNYPVVFSPSAADTYGTFNRLSIGAVGSLGGSRAGNMAVQNADLVLALGSKLCSQMTGQADQFARGAKIFVVDIDPVEHTKRGVKIEKILIADIKDFLNGLLVLPMKPASREWVKKCFEWKNVFSLKDEKFVRDCMDRGEIDLYNFAETLSDVLPEDATVVTDAGFEELIIPSSVRYGKGQRCLFPASQGAMGYAIPAIIGAHYAGKKNIITVVGDGSLMMNLQELLVISSSSIPVKIFVINNNMYAVIRKRQRDLFRNRTIGNDPSDGLASPNLIKIAECFGFQYDRLEDPDSLSKGLKRILEMDRACICEVVCTQEQKYLHTSFVINELKRLVKRPLEDLSPFLPRDVFYKEMVIEPIKE